MGKEIHAYNLVLSTGKRLLFKTHQAASKMREHEGDKDARIIPLGEIVADAVCENCGSPMIGSRKGRQFCSVRCRVANHRKK